MTSYQTQTPYTASFVIFKDQQGRIAFVLRTNTGWMDGYYGLPSGKVEVGEFFTECAMREAKEETGVTIVAKDLKPVLVMHRIELDGSWVDTFFEANVWDGEVHNAEPEKSRELVWLDPKQLPDNMVPPVRFAIEQIAVGKKYCEYKGGN